MPFGRSVIRMVFKRKKGKRVKGLEGKRVKKGKKG